MYAILFCFILVALNTAAVPFTVPSSIVVDLLESGISSELGKSFVFKRMDEHHLNLSHDDQTYEFQYVCLVTNIVHRNSTQLYHGSRSVQSPPTLRDAFAYVRDGVPDITFTLQKDGAWMTKIIQDDSVPAHSILKLSDDYRVRTSLEIILRKKPSSEKDLACDFTV